MWWILAQSPYSPQGNWRQSHRVEPWKQGVRPPDVKENPGSQYCQRLGGQPRPQVHFRYIQVKHECRQTDTTIIEPRLPLTYNIYIYIYMQMIWFYVVSQRRT